MFRGQLFSHPFLPSSTFHENYRCFPMTSLKKSKDAIYSMNYGGKIVMPPSVLEAMMDEGSTSSNPLIFSLIHPGTNKQTHAGVIEFIAEEGRIYLPEWMMKTLGALQGDILKLNNVYLPRGTFVKLQPQSMNFLDITDPRAVLENTLRHFSAMTCGDIIAIDYNDTIYEVLVLETKPSGTSISIYDTDLEVDFAPPPGYQEPRKTEKSISASLNDHDPLVEKIDVFSGTGRKLRSNSSSNTNNLSSSSSTLQNKSSSRNNTSIEKAFPLILPPSKLFFGHHRKHISDDSSQSTINEQSNNGGYSLRE